MSTDEMSETRRKGDNKRLNTLRSLVAEAGDSDTLSIGRKSQLIDSAVNNASGLNRKGSVQTFRSQCELVLDSDVMPHFSSILELSDRMWLERKIEAHSKLHLVLTICKKVKGGTFSRGIGVSQIDRHYTEFGLLP